MSIEGQDSIFGQENSVATAQSSSQAQLPDQENKLDDSIDNQQQVCLASKPVPTSVNAVCLFLGFVYLNAGPELMEITAVFYITFYFYVEMCLNYCCLFVRTWI